MARADYETFSSFHKVARNLSDVRIAANALFREIDTDDSGKISLEEYLEYANVQVKHEQANAKATFAHHDIDESRTIDQHEFKAFIMDVTMHRDHAHGKSFAALYVPGWDVEGVSSWQKRFPLSLVLGVLGLRTKSKTPSYLRWATGPKTPS